MSYVVKHLNTKSELELEFSNHPENILHYQKYDTFVGSSESIRYILECLNK